MLCNLNTEPHLHMFSITQSKVKTKFESYRNNFCITALYLAYVVKMPGLQIDGHPVLPDIPNNLELLLDVENDPSDSDIQKRRCEAGNWFKNISASKMCITLHLALALLVIGLLAKPCSYKDSLQHEALHQVHTTFMTLGLQILI